MKINNISNSTNSQDYKISETRHKDNLEKTDLVQKNDSSIKSLQDPELDEAVMIKAVDQANKSLKQYNRSIEREVHETTKTVMYKLIDSDTDEIIAEFPPKKIQDMVAKMWELAGLFVDEKG